MLWTPIGECDSSEDSSLLPHCCESGKEPRALFQHFSPHIELKQPVHSCFTAMHRFRFFLPVHQTGFTLFETAIVLAMISILAAIAIPNLQALMPRYRLHGAARQLMADLMSARMKAVSRNNEFRILFVNNYQYTILDDINNNGTADFGESAQTKDIRDTYHGVSITKTADPIFYPRGSAAGATLTVTNSSGPISIRVNPSGRVRIN